MRPDRQWMYKRLKDGLLNPEFMTGMRQFIEFACSHPEMMDNDRIRCPCNHRKCQNRMFHEVNTVKLHLYRNGFVPDYYYWTLHGEQAVGVNLNYNVNYMDEGFATIDHAESSNRYHSMVMDAAGHALNPTYMEETPNPEAQKFYDMLRAANEDLYPGCRSHSQLSFVAQLMHMKSEHHMSEHNFDDMVRLMKEITPEGSLVPENFYRTKQLVEGMGLPVEKIDCCKNGCMIYWGENRMLITCKFCGHPRYKRQRRGSKTVIPDKKMYYFPLTPRLQRLFASNATASKMRWHAEHEIEDGVMCHPSDSPAWQHFNDNHPEFASETRNVRLGLSTDGFQPFGQSGQQYSSWPVIVTPYNLPPWLCMKDAYMFLTVLIPGPTNPKDKLDVYLQPLISELNHLWLDGVLTYDISTKQNFQMRAALMWTISDFPAYAMLSGWSTAGRLACPYCMNQTDAFTLSESRKQSWFDNHRKFLPQDHPFRRNRTSFMKNKIVTKEAPPIRSGSDILFEIDQFGLKKVTEQDAKLTNGPICKQCGWRKKSIFWDLPYWSTLLIRHNLDVMHIEKNVFDNVFNTVMNVDGKTKDTYKSRKELNAYCRRPELERDSVGGKYPKACYTLDNQSKSLLCEWLRNLRFPDGYMSNMARCIDMRKLKLFGMKSHDCHVFMQRLIPIAFRELLPNNVWKALTELSLFFKDLTSVVITNDDMARLEEEIPIILCKLERIFPPSFFDSMEHLPVHLPYEARIAGPVQYRWMYPFERYLRRLKNNIRNKARVEGSISNAYLVEEASLFCSHYFEDHVNTRHRKVPRNDDGGRYRGEEYEGNLSIFTQPGRAFGKSKSRFLTEEEYAAAQSYVLLNSIEVEPFIKVYIEELTQTIPNITTQEIDAKLEKEFRSWFNKYAHNPLSNISNQFIKDLAKGPLPKIMSYSGYYVNGYKFHTEVYGSDKATMNSGVCIKGSNYSASECDYYGRLIEVVQLEYPALPIKRTVLFKCEWFDPTPNMGTKVHPQYKLVEVNQKRRFNRYEPFVMAVQACQVNFIAYPGVRRERNEWLAVCKIKARAKYEIPQATSSITSLSNVSPAFQEDGIDIHYIDIENDESDNLVDATGAYIDIEEDDNEEEEEPELQFESHADDEETDEDEWDSNDHDSD